VKIVAPGGWKGHNRGNCTWTVYIGKEYFKNFLLKNHWSKGAEIYIKVFRHSTNTSLLKSSSPELGGGTIRDIFYILKTVEFFTPQLFIFLFLVSKIIRWCVGHDHPG
jgi:hypothetical protein